MFAIELLKNCDRQPTAPGHPPGTAIIAALQHNGKRLMEAELINSISYKLDDLAQRAAELRRYL
ncbi:MAG: hypothetical protein WAS49_07770 [Candidatus Dechloromonas phosphoritropha]|nr:hypothetical protein [Candidatus Dechloromonas phosphoritropha]